MIPCTTRKTTHQVAWLLADLYRRGGGWPSIFMLPILVHLRSKSRRENSRIGPFTQARKQSPTGNRTHSRVPMGLASPLWAQGC